MNTYALHQLNYYNLDYNHFLGYNVVVNKTLEPKGLSVISKSNITKHRKQRSDKFPLTLHPTGQYCKKIRGKIHYFGSDKKEALERYYEQAADLHKGREIKSYSGNEMSTKALC
ncbi:MAG: hypothetical protein OEV87_06855 [Phycisphaerae bacterium]|nr:hypothetical protein [Phycisphaerae bacterium]